jgi:hypothetical protein
MLPSVASTATPDGVLIPSVTVWMAGTMGTGGFKSAKAGAGSEITNKASEMTSAASFCRMLDTIVNPSEIIGDFSFHV